MRKREQNCEILLEMVNINANQRFKCVPDV